MGGRGLLFHVFPHWLKEECLQHSTMLPERKTLYLSVCSSGPVCCLLSTYHDGCVSWYSSRDTFNTASHSQLTINRTVALSITLFVYLGSTASFCCIAVSSPTYECYWSHMQHSNPHSNTLRMISSILIQIL